MRARTSSDRRSGGALLFGFVGARIIAAVIALLTMVVITRSVPVPTVGVYATAMGVVLLLSMFLDLGSTQLLVREATRSDSVLDPVHEYVRTRAYLTVSATLVGIALCLLVLPAEARVTGVVAMGVVLFSFAGMLVGIGQVFSSIREYRVALIGQAFITFLATLVAVKILDWKSAAALTACSVIGGFAGSVYAFVVVHRRTGMPSFVDGSKSIQRLRSLAILGLATALSSVYYRVDGLILLRLRGSEIAAYYAVAYRALDQARLLPTAAMLPLGPFLSRRLAESDRLDAADDLILRKVSVQGGLGLSVLLIAVSDVVVLVLGGTKYRPSVDLLLILAVAVSLSGFVITATLRAIMSDQENALLFASVTAFAFNVTLNVAAIPRWGAEAAAVVTALTELLVVTWLVVHSDAGGARGKLIGAIGVVLAASTVATLKHVAITAGLLQNLVCSAALIALAAGLLPSAYRAVASVGDDTGQPSNQSSCRTTSDGH